LLISDITRPDFCVRVRMSWKPILVVTVNGHPSTQQNAIVNFNLIEYIAMLKMELAKLNCNCNYN